MALVPAHHIVVSKLRLVINDALGLLLFIHLSIVVVHRLVANRILILQLHSEAVLWLNLSKENISPHKLDTIVTKAQSLHLMLHLIWTECIVLCLH